MGWGWRGEAERLSPARDGSRGARCGAAVLLGALLAATVPGPGQAAQAQDPPAREQAPETVPDARLLADLDLLRDLELLRQLEAFRQAEAPRRVPLPRASQEAKGQP
jgi:hypothetical protein